jgi:hypothetical protein
VVDPETADAWNLTHSPTASERYPSWSPDGSRVAFSSNRNGTHNLYLIDADGSNFRQLTRENGASWPGSRAGQRTVNGFISVCSGAARRERAASSPTDRISK